AGLPSAATSAASLRRGCGPTTPTGRSSHPSAPEAAGLQRVEILDAAAERVQIDVPRRVQRRRFEAQPATKAGLRQRPPEPREVDEAVSRLEVPRALVQVEAPPPILGVDVDHAVAFPQPAGRERGVQLTGAREELGIEDDAARSGPRNRLAHRR